MTLGGSIRSEKSKTVWVSRLFALNRTKKTAYMPKFVNIGYTSCLTNIYLYIYIYLELGPRSLTRGFAYFGGITIVTRT